MQSLLEATSNEAGAISEFAAKRLDLPNACSHSSGATAIHFPVGKPVSMSLVSKSPASWRSARNPEFDLRAIV